MKIKRILYVGECNGNSLCRLNAMKRLGYSVEVVTPRKFLPDSAWVSRIFWRFSGIFFVPWINVGLKKFLKKRATYDLVWVNAGDYLFPSSVEILKQATKKIVNYNTDDPYGKRDGNRHLGYLKSVPLYDLIVVVRKPNIAEAYQFGAKQVYFTFMTADEIEHKPVDLTKSDKGKYKFDVLFLGTWFPERGPFMLKLIELGVPLTIVGPNWGKSPEWPKLKNCVASNGFFGKDYSKAIQESKICLGLLSKGNRDEHTTRSMEIPALGSLFCAERTTEHEFLYKDGVEAVFWRTPEECAEKCLGLLQNPSLIDEISKNGNTKVYKNGSFNEDMIKSVLGRVINQ
ncbi:glycosyltransferase [uncultured Paraglaciecola sp.]|uniref:CgeB family protein n=1 Tax=uncultured Paraglaciecola sp. TaxID=1765024 RepID=UPI0030DB4007|tara:strand:- start:11302 stop:12330 length:1029 start_codon:yes stop_codon:yes gene_type:complete